MAQLGKSWRGHFEAAWRTLTEAGFWLGAWVKVLLVTVGSIAAVVFASLIISIVQFQTRLSEARTQNGNITLESVQLIRDHQERVTQLYEQMRKRADDLAWQRSAYQSNTTRQ